MTRKVFLINKIRSVNRLSTRAAPRLRSEGRYNTDCGRPGPQAVPCRAPLQGRGKGEKNTMTGRRSHPRFGVPNPWQGAIRVLRDVVVDRTSRDEVMAISLAPGVVGEAMTLDLMGGGVALGLRVVVTESRPVIVAGAVRHRIQLALLPPVVAGSGAGAAQPITAAPAEAL